MLKLNIGPKIKWLPHGKGLNFEKSTHDSVGYDVQAAVDKEVVIGPNERKLIPTGFCLAIPNLLEGQCRSRSGLAWKHGIMVLNSPGTIDPDYRDEIKVILLNTNVSGSDTIFRVNRGDRIAQMVFSPVMSVELFNLNPTFYNIELEAVNDLPLTSSNRDGGFGSTGITS